MTKIILAAFVGAIIDRFIVALFAANGRDDE